MNKYICLFDKRPQFECEAETSYQAQQKAVAHFQPSKSKRHLVHVHLAERADGSTVTQPTDF